MRFAVVQDVPPADDVRRGIALMLFSTLVFIVLDTVAKYLTRRYPVPEVVWGRYFFHLVFVLPVLFVRYGGVLRTRHLPLQLARSLLLFLTSTLFFFGLRSLGLAEATAIMLAGPLLVTALSVPLLGESVGPRRWAAVVVGFGGALVIVRPGTAAMRPAAVYLLLAVVSNALYQVTTRRLSRYDGSLTTLFYSALIGALASSAVVAWFWVRPDALGWLMLASVGALGAFGHFVLILAFTAAPAAVIAPFTYAGLVWATLFGFVAFGDLPDRWTVTGALIIVASGLYVLHRERVGRGRARAAQAAH